ncbi:hypothetical protein K488DRAFT_88576 [Vararia minispora EC-137]|uniref:Uncharacterized protein n=1 Tax=Vararia minispora EC-137 TaxID=1314806 RepID=A0ACB8QCW8_9AGAM|nr:hypothetical protein K488DRAFT_88576 [Vararia minispora EC-137]
MPLNVDPSSTCDICMDPFQVPGHEADPSKTPHCISCGHIFCRSCLLNVLETEGMEYPVCPHCRKPYRRDKVKPLFVGSDPQRDTPTSVHLADAVRRVDSIVSGLERNGIGALPQDLNEAVDSISGFVQTHVGFYLRTERLVDAFATVLEKYAEKERQIADLEFHRRRHAIADEQESRRNHALEETYLDKIQELENELDKLNVARVYTNPRPMHPSVPPTPEVHKRRNTTGSGGTAASPIVPLPVTEGRTPVSREEVQRTVQALADLRQQRENAEHAPRGDVIEQGNALGLGDGGGHHRSWPDGPHMSQAYTSRRLFEGRVVEQGNARQSAEEPTGADHGASTRESGGIMRADRPAGEHSFPRHTRRASTGSQAALFLESSGPPAEPSRRVDLRSEDECRGHEDRRILEERRDRRARDGYGENRVAVEAQGLGYPETPLRAFSSQSQTLNIATCPPGDTVERRGVPASSMESLPLNPTAPEALMDRIRAPSMARSVSFRAQPVIDSEYATPRISNPTTPYSSTVPTPHTSASSLHPSPNVAPYSTMPSPSDYPQPPRPSPYGPPPALLYTPQPSSMQAPPIPAHTRPHRSDRASSRIRDVLSSAVNPWDVSSPPVPTQWTSPVNPTWATPQRVEPVTVPAVRRNDTLLF